MVFKFNLKRFLISIAIPLIVGGLSALITSENMNLYSRIETPLLSPPGWVFPVVWTILYTLMGVSFYLVWNSNATIFEKKQAFTIYAIQLFLNFIWSPIFFNMRAYLIAFIVLLALWGFVLAMIIKFYKISKLAGILQIPYLIWLTFAGYLNLAIYLLN